VPCQASFLPRPASNIDPMNSVARAVPGPGARRSLPFRAGKPARRAARCPREWTGPGPVGGHPPDPHCGGPRRPL